MGDMCHSMTRVALPVVPGAAKVCRQQEQSVRTELVGQDGVQQHAGDLLDVSATRASENLSPVSVHGEFGTTQLEQVDQESSDNCGSIPTVAAENVPLERVTQEVTQHMNQVPQDDAQESMTDQESDRLVNENVPEDDTTQVEEVVSAQEDMFCNRCPISPVYIAEDVQCLSRGNVGFHGCKSFCTRWCSSPCRTNNLYVCHPRPKRYSDSSTVGCTPHTKSPLFSQWGNVGEGDTRMAAAGTNIHTAVGNAVYRVGATARGCVVETISVAGIRHQP
ncbi:hypothetical protein V6N12_029230 [Hibiscus sabdariffa]|uniref:Uncharacterized protein n=1 Tax=Hibiscus sabdariffa TaxID=183260 RepID=A0ABR2CVI5_9ROSI